MRSVVIGGTSGIGLEVARHRAGRGDQVVLTGRDADRATKVAGPPTPTGLRVPGSGPS